MSSVAIGSGVWFVNMSWRHDRVFAPYRAIPDEFLRQFPSVRREQAIAALELARETLLNRARSA